MEKPEVKEPEQRLFFSISGTDNTPEPTIGSLWSAVNELQGVAVRQTKRGISLSLPRNTPPITVESLSNAVVEIGGTFRLRNANVSSVTNLDAGRSKEALAANIGTRKNTKRAKQTKIGNQPTPGHESAARGTNPLLDNFNVVGDPNDRGDIILSMVNIYKEHSYVSKILAGARKSSPSKTTGQSDEYFDEQYVNDFRLLTAEDEKHYFGQIETALSLRNDHRADAPISPPEGQVYLDATAAYQVIFGANQGLVAMVAKRYVMGTIEWEDVVSQGNAGLSAAITHFDISLGFKFSTYATHWITQSIQRSLSNTARSIRLPVHQIDKLHALRKDQEILEQKLGRTVTIEEIAERSGYSPEGATRLATGGELSLRSLNAPITGQEGLELGSNIPDTKADATDELTTALSNESLIQEVFGKTDLDDVEIFILSMRFGKHFGFMSGKLIQTTNGEKSYDELFDQPSEVDKQSLEFVAGLLGLTRPKLRQAELKAIRKLRNSLS